VDPDAPESPGGSRMLRHQQREHAFGVSPDAQSSLQAIDAHIERHIGPVSLVFDEVVSDIVHVDIHLVPPAPHRPFNTLVTSGMSDLPMAAPPDASSCSHAELVALLPPDWPLTQEALTDEDNYWPLRQLKMLARLPHEHNTWLWIDHTVRNGDPPAPFAPSTELCCAMLEPPISLPREFMTLTTPEGKQIVFLAFIPLYLEENDYALKAGPDALLDLFERAGVRDVIDPARANVCKRSRRRWGRRK